MARVALVVAMLALGCGESATNGGNVTITGLTVFANCMPVVDPDPIIAFWTANVTGANGSTATLSDAKLTVNGSSTVMQTLTVDNPTISLSGGAGSQEQRKTSADVIPSGACSSLCSGATFSLELTYTIDGRMVMVTETGDFDCLF